VATLALDRATVKHGEIVSSVGMFVRAIEVDVEPARAPSPPVRLVNQVA
jgi:hypothetical protein